MAGTTRTASTTASHHEPSNRRSATFAIGPARVEHGCRSAGVRPGRACGALGRRSCRANGRRRHPAARDGYVQPAPAGGGGATRALVGGRLVLVLLDCLGLAGWSGRAACVWQVGAVGDRPWPVAGKNRATSRSAKGHGHREGATPDPRGPVSLSGLRVLDCIIPVARAAFSTARATSPDFGSVSRTLLGAETERRRRRAACAGS